MNIIAPVGTVVDQVSLDIDYEIIEHFSNHLYRSPNKAIEELVTNGFDAAATWVHVFLAGQFGKDAVLVWDNGTSMDQAGLKNLWKLANSPKRNMPAATERTIETKGGIQRKVIGKFGIGKVASYTMGNKIAHLCKKGKDFLLVEVDYEELNDELTHKDGKYMSPIKSLSETEAKQYANDYFSSAPDSFDACWSEDTWTLAIISKLKNRNLTAKRLSWVLGHSMPLRPDFTVLVDNSKVVPKLLKTGAFVQTDFANDKIQATLKKEWEQYAASGVVTGDIAFGTREGLDFTETSLETPFVSLPVLGEVWGKFLLFDEPIQKSQDEDEPRTHGFFVMVRGRLLNPDDDKMFFGSDPDFGTFYRVQIILYADGLDEELMADRERVQQDTVRAQELKFVQKAVYRALGVMRSAREKEKADKFSPVHRLPTFSMEHYIQPLSRILAKYHQPEIDFGVHDVKVSTKVLGENEPLAVWSTEDKGFNVNSRHPFYQVIRERTGDSQKGTAILREYESLAVSEKLFEGYLYDLGLSEEMVENITTWRDGMYRALAKASRDPIEQLARELQDASYKPGNTFEKAIARVLEEMGFKAEHDGASGKKDILMVAPAGDRTYKFTFEAKAMKGHSDSLSNSEAEVGGAVRHRDKVGAEWAVIVSRKFAGFETNRVEEPAIIGECTSARGVSILTVEALTKLLKAVDRYKYPLTELKEIFTTLEPPAEKILRIEKLDKPLLSFDYLELLEKIRAAQEERSDGKPYPWAAIYFDHYKHLDKDDFRRKVLALAGMAPLHIFVNEKDEIALLQSPDKICSVIYQSLERFKVEDTVNVDKGKS